MDSVFGFTARMPLDWPGRAARQKTKYARTTSSEGDCHVQAAACRPCRTPVRAPSAPPATQRFSKMAIWSLVLSILWLGGLGAVAGIMLGVSARRRIAGTGERGAGLALAGIVVGVISLIIAVAYWAFLATHVGGHGGSGGGGYGY